MASTPPLIETVGPRIVLIGTAHIAQSSVDEVEAQLRTRRPDKVLVELDTRRHEAIRDPDAWQRTDIIQVLREKKQHVFLLQLYLASMQARMGRETGVAPGTEMLRAIQVAAEIGAEVVLVDRDVSVTLKRGFAAMGLWARLRLFWRLWMELLTPAEDEAVDIESILETDAITQMTEEFARFAPAIKTALIDERDAYMASHIHEQAVDARVVAIVGAGHLAGIRRHLEGAPDAIARSTLEEVPRRRITIGKIVAYALPAAVIAAFIWLALQGRWAELRDAAAAWIIINGALSALGALLARGHILSVLTAFVAAPLTSLNPALAAGWFAGLVEAKMHTPTVADFQAIKQIETLKDFWKNGVVRIVMVTALANLGSVAGTWIAGFEIARTLGGG